MMGRGSSVLNLRAILTLGMLGIVGLTGCGSNAPLPDDQGKSIAESFLTEVRNGKVDAAWESTSAEFKSLMGKEFFRNFVKKQPTLRANAVFESATLQEHNGLKLVQCQFKPESGKGGPIKVTLAPQAGGWQVERLVVD